MADITKVKLPNGSEYNLKDSAVPAWAKTTNPPSHGNITSGGDITTTVAIASGDRLVINDESESKINNSTITFGTSATQFLANNGTWQTYTAPSNPNWTATTGVTSILNKPTIPAAQVNSNWTATTGVASILNKPSIPSTYTDVGAASAAHTHGNITNAGDITATATIANGDRLIINDESASKVINSTITFGTSTTSFLANNGTWQSYTAGQGLSLSTNTFSAVNNLVIGTQTAATNVWTGTLPTGVSDYYNGMEINYYLPKAGNSSAATLNLSSKGAKPVYNGESKNGNTTTHYPEGALLHLVYVVKSDLNSGNGCWKVSNYRNSTYYYESAYTTTGASTAAKAATCSFFTFKKCHFQLLIQNANTSATALTLNVNGTGAKAIYINGSASSTTNYTLPAGAYLVYCNGTNYYLRTDGKITGDITGSATSVPSISSATIQSILNGTYS